MQPEMHTMEGEDCVVTVYLDENSLENFGIGTVRDELEAMIGIPVNLTKIPQIVVYPSTKDRTCRFQRSATNLDYLERLLIGEKGGIDFRDSEKLFRMWLEKTSIGLELTGLEYRPHRSN